MKTDHQGVESLASERPVFIMAFSTHEPSAAQMKTFLTHGEAHERGVITFKAAAVRGGRIRSMILPAGAFALVSESLAHDLGLDASNIHVFTLMPLHDRPASADAPATARGTRETGSWARESGDRSAVSWPARAPARN